LYENGSNQGPMCQGILENVRESWGNKKIPGKYGKLGNCTSAAGNVPVIEQILPNFKQYVTCMDKEVINSDTKSFEMVNRNIICAGAANYSVLSALKCVAVLVRECCEID